MILKNKISGLNEISNINEYSKNENKKYLFIGMCGYENRSLSMAQLVCKNDYDSIYGLVNDEYKDMKEIKKAVESYKDYKAIIRIISGKDLFQSISLISEIINIERDEKRSLSVNIDISSMPRLLYCSLPNSLGKLIQENDELNIWYVPGEYVELDYPTAGISKLVKFSGKNSLRPHERAHILGLGFDSIRSEGMLTVLDPSYLVTYYSNPSYKVEYTKRIIDENKSVLERSNLTIPLNIFDFESSLSKLISITTSLLSEYEVILVPDGPKPFIFIGSIIPEILCVEGLTALHINSNRKNRKRFVDVKEIGKPIGLKFRKKESIASCEG